jgi:hypothetical protein
LKSVAESLQQELTSGQKDYPVASKLMKKLNSVMNPNKFNAQEWVKNLSDLFSKM